jgi:hypothetical protein
MLKNFYIFFLCIFPFSYELYFCESKKYFAANCEVRAANSCTLFLLFVNWEKLFYKKKEIVLIFFYTELCQENV